MFRRRYVYLFYLCKGNLTDGVFCVQASVCVYANDCAYLAARWCAACVTNNASRLTGTDAAARRSVSIAAAVSPLTGSGDRALRALVARTRAEIFHALDGKFLVIFGYFWLFLVISIWAM